MALMFTRENTIPLSNIIQITIKIKHKTKSGSEENSFCDPIFVYTNNTFAHIKVLFVIYIILKYDK